LWDGLGGLWVGVERCGRLEGRCGQVWQLIPVGSAAFGANVVSTLVGGFVEPRLLGVAVVGSAVGDGVGVGVGAAAGARQHPSAPCARRLVECTHGTRMVLARYSRVRTGNLRGPIKGYSQGTHRVLTRYSQGTQGVLTRNQGHITFTASSQYPHRSPQYSDVSVSWVQAHLPTRRTAGCSEICLHRRGAC
jgi:hypothetical protein